MAEKPYILAILLDSPDAEPIDIQKAEIRDFFGSHQKIIFRVFNRDVQQAWYTLGDNDRRFRHCPITCDEHGALRGNFVTTDNKEILNALAVSFTSPLILGITAQEAWTNYLSLSRTNIPIVFSEFPYLSFPKSSSNNDPDLGLTYQEVEHQLLVWAETEFPEYIDFRRSLSEQQRPFFDSYCYSYRSTLYKYHMSPAHRQSIADGKRGSLVPQGRHKGSTSFDKIRVFRLKAILNESRTFGGTKTDRMIMDEVLEKYPFTTIAISTIANDKKLLKKLLAEHNNSKEEVIQWLDEQRENQQERIEINRERKRIRAKEIRDEEKRKKMHTVMGFAVCN